VFGGTFLTLEGEVLCPECLEGREEKSGIKFDSTTGLIFEWKIPFKKKAGPAIENAANY